MYDHLSLVSLRLRGTRSRNKRACLLRFEKGDLSYLSLRRTPVVGTLAPASSGLKDPVPGALSPHATQCCARTGFPTGARENPPPQIACGRRSRLSSKVHTSGTEKERYRAYVEVLWVGLPARYLRGGNVRGRGLQKSRWRVRSVCIVPTHPDGQDCDILRYCALFSILNGALRLAMAHRPPDLVALFRAVSNPCWCGMVRPDRRPVPVRVMVAVPTALSRPHATRDRGCGRCRQSDGQQASGRMLQFRQVSKKQQDRRTLRGRG